MTPKKSQRKYSSGCPPCFLGSAVLLIFFGVVLLATWSSLFNFIIRTQFVLTPDSNFYAPWKKTPFPYPLEVFLFNWTNPEDIYNASVKPRFQEVGPYRFKEVFDKTNVTWNENGTVSFRHRKFWFYDEEGPNGDLQGNVTTVNPVVLSTAHLSRSWPFWRRQGLLLLNLIPSTMNMTHTVDKLLFKGVDDPLFKAAEMFSSDLGDDANKIDKFGFFYKLNGTNHLDGVLNMGTGTKSTTFGQIYSWNHQTRTSFFESTCGRIEGSAGDFYTIDQETNTVSFFPPGLCRTIVLSYTGKNEVHSIMGNKYTMGARTLDNGTIYPDNECFCNGGCVPSGLINTTSCRFGAPFFMSLPHFYNADPYYTNLVEGLKPEREKHEFSLTLEPVTGIVLEATGRMQLNILMQPIPEVSLFRKAPKVFFPLMWTQNVVKIPEKDAVKLKLLLIMPTLCISFGVVLAVLGCLLLIYVVYQRFLIDKRKYKQSNLEQAVPLKGER